MCAGMCGMRDRDLETRRRGKTDLTEVGVEGKRRPNENERQIPNGDRNGGNSDEMRSMLQMTEGEV